MLFLMTLLGTGGDILPGLVIGRELVRRGHRVTVLSYDLFEPQIRQMGLPYVSIGSTKRFLAQVTQAAFWQPDAQSVGMNPDGYLAQVIGPVFDYIAERRQQRPVLICTRNAYGARFASEKFGLACLSLAYAPSQYMTAQRYPFSQPRLRRAPLWVRRLSIAWGDYLYNREILPKLNPLRLAVGLRPLRNMRQWDFFGTPSLALFPAWLDDLGALADCGVRQGDFVFYSDDEQQALAPALEAFLQAGSAPIVCTFGTGIAHVASIFQRLVGALQTMGMRAVFVTKFAQNLPTEIGADVLVVEHADFAPLLRRSPLLVHHGGIGTAAQAVRAGIAQLIIPQAFDQPDNAHLIRGLGLGDLIDSHDFSEADLAQAMERAMAQVDRDKLAQLRANMIGNDGMAAMVEHCQTFFAVHA